MLASFIIELAITAVLEVLAAIWEAPWGAKRDSHREKLAAIKRKRRARRGRHE